MASYAKEHDKILFQVAWNIANAMYKRKQNAWMNNNQEGIERDAKD